MTQSELQDHERFVSHFVRHERSIYSFLMTIVPNDVDVEEIVQDASLVMWQKFSQFEEGTNFRNWAFQIAKFTAMNHIRKIKRDRLVFTSKLVELLSKEWESNSSELESRRSTFRYCITKLPEKDQKVVAACYAENQSVKQYADSQNRTSNAVYKQLNRIRQTLLQCVRSAHGRLDASPVSFNHE